MDNTIEKIKFKNTPIAKWELCEQDLSAGYKKPDPDQVGTIFMSETGRWYFMYQEGRNSLRISAFFPYKGIETQLEIDFLGYKTTRR